MMMKIGTDIPQEYDRLLAQGGPPTIQSPMGTGADSIFKR